MSLSDEIRNFDSCASDYIREDWADRIGKMEAEIQLGNTQIRFLLNENTKLQKTTVDNSGGV